jgi:hypothetical protein
MKSQESVPLDGSPDHPYIESGARLQMDMGSTD